VTRWGKRANSQISELQTFVSRLQAASLSHQPAVRGRAVSGYGRSDTQYVAETLVDVIEQDLR
jgi:hypothetical protein